MDVETKPDEGTVKPSEAGAEGEAKVDEAEKSGEVTDPATPAAEETAVQKEDEKKTDEVRSRDRRSSSRDRRDRSRERSRRDRSRDRSRRDRSKDRRRRSRSRDRRRSRSYERKRSRH